MQLLQTIPLPNVAGRLDHLAIDPKRGRLFVAALGNNTVEVVDLKAGRHVAALKGLQEPQGVAVDPRTERVVVANGRGGDVRLFDAGTLRPLQTVSLGDDADNVRFDPATTGKVYVGFGEGALAVLDARSGSLNYLIPLTGHPESFQLETVGPRVYVNVPSRGHIAVADRKAGKVIATWPVTDAAANFPMALDEVGRRLFVGCRNPAAVLLFDTETGKQISRVEIGGDTDDVFWDARRKRAYVSCGAGFLDVLQQSGTDSYQRVAHLPTVAGARTSLFVPESDRFYIAVPRRGVLGAEIRVFTTRD